MAVRKGGLGKGLEALIADATPLPVEIKPVKKSSKKEADDADEKDAVLYISIHDIKPNKNQPRKTFDEEKITDLAKSISENGIIQPTVVRKTKPAMKLLPVKEDGEQQEKLSFQKFHAL